MSSRTAAQRARIAVAVLFFTNGALFANLLPRFPEIKQSLAMSDSIYGLAVAAFPAGAITAGLAAATLIRRYGSARVALVGTISTGIGMWAAGSAPAVAFFIAALFLAGVVDALTDVAQNAHGLRVQRALGRTIINSLHALWSVGAVVGGLMAAGAIALGVPVPLHLGISAVLCAAAGTWAYQMCLPGFDHDSSESDSGLAAASDPDSANVATGAAIARSLSRPRLLLSILALVMLAVAGAVVEDAGNSWASLYLGTELSAPGALAAAGFIALVAAQFLGRIVGDRLVDRWGQRTVAQAGGLLIAAGMGLALLFPTVPGTIAGFAAAGFGAATLIPAAMQQADQLPGLRPGTGLTIVSWLMRLGFLLSPPIVGQIAQQSSIRSGLFVVPIVGAIVVAAALVLRPRPTAHQPSQQATSISTPA